MYAQPQSRMMSLLHLFLLYLLVVLPTCQGKQATPLFDELPAEVERIFGGDPKKLDTDGDGLTDGYEIRYGFPYLRPDLADSDHNQVSDADEDNDGDTLSNLEEQTYGTSPIEADSDRDQLSDAEEIVHKTDPRNADTDGDGMLDGHEIANGTDPLKADADQITTSFKRFTVHDHNGKQTSLSLTMRGQGDLARTVRIRTAADALLPGQASPRFAISTTHEAVLEQAKISLPITPGTRSLDTLAIYGINPHTQFWERLPSQVNFATLSIDAEAPYLSTFVVAESNAFEQALYRIPHTCDDIEDPNASPADIVLVIDSSGSMSSNDPQNLRIEAARQFADIMKPVDRVAVVDFDNVATLLQPLTHDTEAVKTAIGHIDASGETDIGAGVSMAINQLGSQPNTDNRIRAVVLLTDGDGDYDPNLTTTMVHAGIRAFTIGLGNGTNPALLEGIATGTNGGYKHLDNAGGLVGIFGQFSTVFGDDGRDSDNDGLTDCQEIQGVYLTQLGEIIKTDPENPDTDGDGMADSTEVGTPFRVMTLHNTPWVAAGESNPRAIDTDNDGLNDPEEFRQITNPFSRDSDGDGLDDFDEISLYETNPNDIDTDDDTIHDFEEVLRLEEGFNPAIFDYQLNQWFRDEFLDGFFLGDLEEVDNIPRLSGQIVSGIIVVGDVRDLLVNLFKAEWLNAGLTAIGLLPAAGDITKAGAAVSSFVARHSHKTWEMMHAVDHYFPSICYRARQNDPFACSWVFRFIPEINKTVIWLKPIFIRGTEIEKAIAKKIPGIALLGNFPKIDIWDPLTRIATSIKSIDLDAKTYQDLRAFKNRVRRCTKQMILNKKIKGRIKKTDTPDSEKISIEIDPDDVSSYQLVLVLPRAPSAEYLRAIKEVRAEFTDNISILTQVM